MGRRAASQNFCSGYFNRSNENMCYASVCETFPTTFMVIVALFIILFG